MINTAYLYVLGLLECKFVIFMEAAEPPAIEFYKYFAI